MKIISAKEAEALAVTSLGLDAHYIDLTMPEALAALVRKTAGFVCPCTFQKLRATVVNLLQPIYREDDLSEVVSNALDAVIDYGDIVETDRGDFGGEGFLLYLVPPSFVRTSENTFLLFGIVPDGQETIPPELRDGLTPALSARRLRVDNADNAADTLIQTGYIRLKLEAWLKCPARQDAARLVRKYDEALLRMGPPGIPENVSIADPSRSVKFYKGRWVPLKNHNGRFLARRSRQYGAQLWSYLEALDGQVIRLLDLPCFEKHWNAFDEARHLLQALDAVAGKPQVFRVRRDRSTHTATLDLFSPVPSWAIRKWECVGTRAVPDSSLLSYVFADSNIDAECRFATEMMWLKQI